MKRYFLLALVVLCFSQAVYGFEITNSKKSDKAYVPYVRYAEKFTADFLPTVSKYTDEQREIAENTFNEAIAWINGDITSDSEVRESEITVYEGFSPVTVYFKKGFYRYFQFDGNPDYEWIDEKLIKAGATRYKGIAGDKVIYSMKPGNNRISFIPHFLKVYKFTP